MFISHVEMEEENLRINPTNVYTMSVGILPRRRKIQRYRRVTMRRSKEYRDT